MKKTPKDMPVFHGNESLLKFTSDDKKIMSCSLPVDHMFDLMITEGFIPCIEVIVSVERFCILVEVWRLVSLPCNLVCYFD